MSRINILFDQRADTGIGHYASDLYRLLSAHLPDLKLVSLSASSFGASETAARLPGSETTAHQFLVPFVTGANERLARRTVGIAGQNAHICGAHCCLTDISERTLVTVHDYYFRVPELSSIGRPSSLLREAYTNWLMVRLPRQISSAVEVVVPSDFVQHELREKLGIRSTTIHHWVDTRLFHPRDKLTLRKELALPADKRLVLSVGGATVNKNARLLGGIVKRLRDPYVLIKIGTPIQTTNPRVMNFGLIHPNRYPLFFAACDAYVHTSLQEGFGRPLLHAMASGLPIVSASSSTAPEILSGSGILVDSQKPEEYLSALASIDRLPDHYAQLGLVAAEKFSPDVALRKYVEVYSRVFRL